METLSPSPIAILERTSSQAPAPTELDDQVHSIIANSNDMTVEMVLGPDFARETATNPGVLAWWERTERDETTERLIRPGDNILPLPDLPARFRGIARVPEATIAAADAQPQERPQTPPAPDAPRPRREVHYWDEEISELEMVGRGIVRHRRQAIGWRARATEWVGDAVAAAQGSLRRSASEGKLARLAEAVRPNRRRVALLAGATALAGMMSMGVRDGIFEGTPERAVAEAGSPFAGPAYKGTKFNGPRASAQEAKPLVKPIQLNPDKYTASQRELLGCGNNKIDLPNGKQVASKNLKYGQRVDVIEQKLTLAEQQISVEGYKQFVPTIVDLTDVVPKKLSNYRGTHWAKGKPTLPQDIDYFVWHFTATPRKANNYDGLKFARSMQNSGELGVQFALNRSGTLSWLTKNRTYHVRGHNTQSFGVEIAGACQEDIEPTQYRNAVYATAWYLIENKYITKNTQSVEKVVNATLRGHRELNPKGHSDMPGIVMDQGRRMTIDLLHDMGYGKTTANTTVKALR